MSGRTALLLGATGLVGSHCLNYLLEDPYYQKVVVFARHKPQISHPRLKVIIMDFDQLAGEWPALLVDHIFCCLGTTLRQAGSQEAFRKVDYQYVLEAARLGLRKGAEEFLLVSSLGADPHSRFFYNRVKGEAERDLKALPYRGVQIFRPSLLTGSRPEFRLGERIGKAALTLMHPLLRGSWKKYRATPAKEVARSMVEIAKTELKGVHIFESDQIRFFCSRLRKTG